MPLSAAALTALNLLVLMTAVAYGTPLHQVVAIILCLITAVRLRTRRGAGTRTMRGR
jgi:hypothetical protein